MLGTKPSGHLPMLEIKKKHCIREICNLVYILKLLSRHPIIDILIRTIENHMYSLYTPKNIKQIPSINLGRRLANIG